MLFLLTTRVKVMFYHRPPGVRVGNTKFAIDAIKVIANVGFLSHLYW